MFLHNAQQSRIVSSFLVNNMELRQYLMRYSFCYEDVEDVMQEVFLRAYSAGNYRQIHSPKLFLFSVAKNIALSEISRKTKHAQRSVTDLAVMDKQYSEESLEVSLYRQQQFALLVETLQTLPPKCQRVFVMSKVYGFSHKEISCELDISLSTVEKHVAKGSKICRQHIRYDL